MRLDYLYKKKPLQEPKAQSEAQNNAIGDPNSAFPAVSWPYNKQSRPGNKAAVCVPRHSKPPTQF